MKGKDIDRVFEKLAMRTRQSGDKLAWFVHEGKTILHTKRSHGAGDVGHTAHLIRQQLKVSEEVFRGLINCPVDREAYVEVLRQKGLLN